MYDQAQEAGQVAGATADALQAMLYPGDELRGPRDDLPPEAQQALDAAIKALGVAEDALAPGIGQPDVQTGRGKLAEARELLAPLVNALWMQQGLRDLIRRTVESIDRASRLVA
jgi:hypothetical protein